MRSLVAGARPSRGSLLLSAMLVIALSLTALPAIAQAATTTITSQNWAGYAAHGHDAKFRNVTASWRQPSAKCVAGKRTYSSFWVGIGGYSLKSNALEQIGTELDCRRNGTEDISAWYELLPAPSRTIRMRIHPGDLLKASVHVSGHRATMTLRDLSRHRSFDKTVHAHTVDVSSAEWITEAPSNCAGNSCVTLPLADFQTVTFTKATAITTDGVKARIDDHKWNTTRLLLGYHKHHGALIAKADTAHAVTSKLASHGGGFEVRWSGTLPSTSTSSGSDSGGYSPSGPDGDSGGYWPGQTGTNAGFRLS